ncbi:MAG TPA: SpoIID/LytB domain-containing protein [Solirubrobacterales bacterium]|nr:SpoIID/LytB domain-containing protein [Solirubrobacterales bacterium]
MRTRSLTATLSLALAAALCAGLMLSASAGAAVSWVVNGRGFGHGVGMSAYGAYGFALEGKGYRFILGHYYRGTSLGTVEKSPVVRVLLDISPGDVGFSGASGACGVALDPRRRYEAHRSVNSVRLRSSRGKRLANCGRRLRAAGRGTIEIAGVGRFRGAFETVPTESDAGSLNVVNALALEQYVKGVMPNEVPASWPVEELKAHSVAVRSIALTGGVDGNGFDLYDDTRSQVYEGLESEEARTNEAVKETRGQVVTYNGEVAQTFYSACSGGHTESVVNVFGTAIPYLVGVPDPYDYHCPLHTWTLRFSGPEISARLGGYLKGRLKKVVVTKRGVTPRIIEAKLIGTGGVSIVTGEQLEVALGGYDTWMTFRKLSR